MVFFDFLQENEIKVTSANSIPNRNRILNQSSIKLDKSYRI